MLRIYGSGIVGENIYTSTTTNGTKLFSFICNVQDKENNEPITRKLVIRAFGRLANFLEKEIQPGTIVAFVGLVNLYRGKNRNKCFLQITAEYVEILGHTNMNYNTNYTTQPVQQPIQQPYPPYPAYPSYPYPQPSQPQYPAQPYPPYPNDTTIPPQVPPQVPDETGYPPVEEIPPAEEEETTANDYVANENLSGQENTNQTEETEPTEPPF